MEHTNILVINDQPLPLSAVEKYLRDAGYSRIDCDNGLTAKRRLTQSRYDLIIQDLQRPSPNGFEFYYWIKTQPSLSNIPIVLVTASDPCYVDERRRTVIRELEFEGTFRAEYHYRDSEFGPRPDYIPSKVPLYIEGLGFSPYDEELSDVVSRILSLRAGIKDVGNEFSLRNACLWPAVLKLLSR